MADSKLGKLTLAALGKGVEVDDQKSGVGGSNGGSSGVGGSNSGAVGGTNNEQPSGSSGRVDAPPGVQHLSTLLARGDSELDEEIERLKTERETMKKDKKRVSQQLKNTERKKSRLRNRAKLLSSSDLLEVYAMRMRTNAKAEPKNQAASPAAAPAAEAVSKP